MRRSLGYSMGADQVCGTGRVKTTRRVARPSGPTVKWSIAPRNSSGWPAIRAAISKTHSFPLSNQLASRIVVELIYARVEMLFDETLKPKEVARIAASMMASHLQRVMP